MKGAEKQKPVRILVVDDDEGMQSLLCDVLSSEGYFAKGVSNGEKALRAVVDGVEKPDAIICDLNMPGINGFNFLSIMKKLGIVIPTILITAFGTEKTEHDARAQGAFGYLSKPFNLCEMNYLVRKATKGVKS